MALGAGEEATQNGCELSSGSQAVLPLAATAMCLRRR